MQHRNPLKISHSESKKLIQNRFIRLALLVVTVLPLLYGVLYLWAFWNPYSRLNQIPVAVVNNDQGATADSKSVNFGNELVDNLKSTQTLKWDFVDLSSAQNGLEDHKYYAEIEVPADFSKNITSVSSDNPQKAVLNFRAREANSLIATQLTNRVMMEVSQVLQQKIVAGYFSNIFVNTRASANDLLLASQASRQITDGIMKSKTGSDQLSSGAQTASSGAGALSNALIQLDSASDQIANGTSSASSGASTLNAGLGQINSSIISLADGSHSLASGTQQAQNGVALLLQNNTAMVQNLNTANLLLQNPDAINSTYGVANKYVAQNIISGIITQADSTDSQKKISDLEDGLNQLVTGSNNLNTGLNTLGGVFSTQIIPSSQQLNSGLFQLKGATGQLSVAMNQTSSGASVLSTGIDQIADGQSQLSSGLGQLGNGSKTLATKLSEGAQTALAQTDTAKTDKTTPVLSNPVKLTDVSFDKVSNYGTGFAPYFIPLALWVGSLVLFLVIKVDGRSEEEKNKPAKALALSKFLTLIKVGTAQTIVLDLVLIFALGLHPTSYFYLFTFTILISWCFLAILQLLVAAFQDGGKFLGIVLLMLQLTSASGTYPIETSPDFFQKISPYLPMTYAVRGLREIVSGGNASNIAVQYGIIALFMVSFLIVLVLTFDKLRKSKLDLTV